MRNEYIEYLLVSEEGRARDKRFWSMESARECRKGAVAPSIEKSGANSRFEVGKRSSRSARRRAAQKGRLGS